jgi:hypothetical protein
MSIRCEMCPYGPGTDDEKQCQHPDLFDADGRVYVRVIVGPVRPLLCPRRRDFARRCSMCGQVACICTRREAP